MSNGRRLRRIMAKRPKDPRRWKSNDDGLMVGWAPDDKDKIRDEYMRMQTKLEDEMGDRRTGPVSFSRYEAEDADEVLVKMMVGKTTEVRRTIQSLRQKIERDEGLLIIATAPSKPIVNRRDPMRPKYEAGLPKP